MARRDRFRVWDNPDPDTIDERVEGFLRRLAGPTLIRITGKRRGLKRALVVLSHGNEPSGLIAVHRYLKFGLRPLASLLIFIPCVEAALESPLFTHRHLPDERDFNRCFRPPYDDRPGRLAQSLLALLTSEEPECLLDLHNTSGSGPAFGVVTWNDPVHEALTSIFSNRLIITGKSIGALMDLSEKELPTVTIECGYREDPAAHEIAFEGILRYANREQVLRHESGGQALDVMANPTRVEVQVGTPLEFLDQADLKSPLVISTRIDQYNFREVDTHQSLGWLRIPLREAFKAINPHEEDVLENILRLKSGTLYPAQPLKLIMATTSPTIARGDCLFYAVKADGAEIRS